MPDIDTTLDSLRREGPARIESAGSLDELAAVESELVGRDSPIAALRRGLGQLPPEQRPEAGRRINEVAQELQAAIAARRAALAAAAEAARLEAERLDLTLPGRRVRRGTEHLINQTLEEITDIFVSIGYTLATGPEAETAFYNFTALNVPDTHPARHESDTLYLDYGDDPENVLLRTQTSPMQARWMEAHDPPVHIVVPGRVYRRDTLDPTHSPVFHQVEGLAVDVDVTFADLRGTLEYFVHEFFGPRQQVRFLPSYFPFTEPSAEMHASCFNCDGGGCRICSHTGWIEVLGCGMVDPAVFEAVGYDPSRVTGFAFGFGVDRMAMIRHGITDLRHFYEADVRVLEQFA